MPICCGSSRRCQLFKGVDMSEDKTFSIIPTIILTSNLSDKAKLLWAVLNSRCQKYGVCNAGDKHLAETLNTSKRTIQTRLAELVDARLIFMNNGQSKFRKIRKGSENKNSEKNLVTVPKTADHSAENGRHNKISNINKTKNNYIVRDHLKFDELESLISVREFVTDFREILIDMVKDLNFKDPNGIIDQWFLTNVEQNWENQTVHAWMQRLYGYLKNREKFFHPAIAFGDHWKPKESNPAL